MCIGTFALCANWLVKLTLGHQGKAILKLLKIVNQVFVFQIIYSLLTNYLSVTRKLYNLFFSLGGLFCECSQLFYTKHAQHAAGQMRPVKSFN